MQYFDGSTITVRHAYNEQRWPWISSYPISNDYFSVTLNNISRWHVVANCSFDAYIFNQLSDGDTVTLSHFDKGDVIADSLDTSYTFWHMIF